MTDPLTAGTDAWAAWLAGRPRRALHLPEFRRAAVLVTLSRDDDPRLLLTVRASHLPTHQGQISFPGGSLEPGETVVEAALREAVEEVGLDLGTVEVLGELDDVFTPVGFHVTPVLARVTEPLTLTLTGEVAELLRPSLAELRAAPRRYEDRVLPDGTPVRMVRYDWHGHDIWGMTARVLEDLIDHGPA